MGPGSDMSQGGDPQVGRLGPCGDGESASDGGGHGAYENGFQVNG